MNKQGQKNYIPNFNPASKAKLGNQLPSYKEHGKAIHIDKADPANSQPVHERMEKGGGPKQQAKKETFPPPVTRGINHAPSKTLDLFKSHSSAMKGRMR